MTPALYIDLSKVRVKEGYPGKIVVDGLILDHGGRNRYSTALNHKIVRPADPKTGMMPTPESGALVVRASKNGMFDKIKWDITIQNNIVMNSAPTMGAMSIAGYKGSKVIIRNNLVINNTGTGIYVGSSYAGGKNDPKGPEFRVEDNTVLFTWKHEPSSQSFSGNAMDFDQSVRVTLSRNVLAYADRHLLYNPRSTTLLLKNNLLSASVDTEYLEFNTKISLVDMEDQADAIHEDSESNGSALVKVPIDKKWLKLYGSRVLVNRVKAEANIRAQSTRANALRGMLGFNLRAGSVKYPKSDVWLPRLSVENAVKAGLKKYRKVGCQKP